MKNDGPYLPGGDAQKSPAVSSWRVGALLGLKTLVAFVLSAVVLLFFTLSGDLPTSYPGTITIQPANLDNPFAHLQVHCANSTPISAGTFLSRQRSLAQVLYREGIGAYVAEPGASATYFANISARQWHTSERVFLVVVTPVVLGSTEDGSDEVEAQVSILAPKFEEDRARLLAVPSKRPIIYLTWAEEQSPYETLSAALGNNAGVVTADESVRLFVSEGLKNAADGRLDVRMAPPSVRALRERKGDEELALMRCANEVTLLAIRAVRERMYIGIRESEVGQMMDLALATAGLKNTFALVQFGENAALPHGSGSDRVLHTRDLALIDTGGSLHNYESDVTRTFALPDSDIPEKHVRIWEIVSKVQAHALDVAHKGVEARTVDEAARSYMDGQEAGISQYFSHRLGHGIGLEGHESPYLRRGADNQHRLEAGNAMSDEPGIYILGQVGVRLEDCFYISQEGHAMLLTSGVGGFAQDLMNP
ncbi:peptidase M24 [Ceratobasidium sp. AG-I]|nr:peptidase M24 [Ceratobasidium sp. AG-I]